jgi:hypothetical protein
MKRMPAFAVHRAGPDHVCFGSKADMGLPLIDVRFTPKSGHWEARLRCPLSAISGQQTCLL